jgi:hypothetical protein
MRNEPNIDSGAVISAIFCELFTATNAVRALNQVGFEDSDVEVVGILAGRVPDLTDFLYETGLPLEHTSYYRACLEDGGVLVIVHARQLARKKKALAVLKQQGGTFAPAAHKALSGTAKRS